MVRLRDSITVVAVLRPSAFVSLAHWKAMDKHIVLLLQRSVLLQEAVLLGSCLADFLLAKKG